MSSNILDTLYAEYAALQHKITKVTELINMYGGTVSNSEMHTINHLSDLSRADYPKNGTWKDKILFALKLQSQSMTVRDIVEKLKYYEPTLPDKDLPTTIGQYCYILSKNEDIVQHKAPGETNRYSLKSK